jgi:hypothetical protein
MAENQKHVVNSVVDAVFAAGWTKVSHGRRQAGHQLCFAPDPQTKRYLVFASRWLVQYREQQRRHAAALLQLCRRVTRAIVTTILGTCSLDSRKRVAS